MNSLSRNDPEIFNAIELERKRQQETINLIASENYASHAILEAQGSFLTDKYAEGYPGRRYYGGCDNVDIIERLAIQRAKELFFADHANVQPHSGAQANMAAYFALIECGDTILGMDLSHGGHLTHGAKASFSGVLYNVVSYGLNEETERIDYVQMEDLAKKNRPKVIVCGASAYPRIIDFQRIREIADTVGARMVTDIAHIAGLVAAGLHPSPVPYADVVTSTTHKTLRGPRGGFILCREALAQAIDSAVFPRMQGGPLMHVVAAKAVAFKEAMQPEFAAYQQRILDNAQALAAGLKNNGLRLVTGGTDNHIVLVDLSATGVTGKQAEEALGRAGIVVNRNQVPFAKSVSPKVANGMRLGTPAVSSRGMGEAEMKWIAAAIIKLIHNIDDSALQQRTKEEAIQMCGKFPVPGIE